MPKYLISYRKTEETGQKPEWAAFTARASSPWRRTPSRSAWSSA